MAKFAEKIIQENFNLQDPILDLGNCGLDGSEDKLFQLLEKAGHVHTLIFASEWSEFDEKSDKYIVRYSQNRGKINQLTQVPRFFPRSLKSLVLTGSGRNNLDLYPLAPFELIENLEELNLAGVQIDDKSIKYLRDLQNLVSLDLSSTNLTYYHFITGFQKLKHLNLSNIDHLKLSFLRDLPNLHSLNLSNFNGSFIIDGLQNLHYLDLSNTEIVDISSLNKLTNLRTLNLSNNEIQNITSLENLKQLRYLDLSNNQINEVTGKIIDRLPSLKYLNLENNPIRGIDREVFSGNKDKNYLPSLKSYFAHAQKGKVKNQELKIIIIGNGRVGKTSIVSRLLHNKFKGLQESTHAIKIEHWDGFHIHKEGNKQELHTSIWDFGGQDIYHATHKLFMRTKAIFLLVWDQDTENQKQDTDKQGVSYENYSLDYWLDYCHPPNSESPIVIIQNKIDIETESSSTLPFDKLELKRNYPNIHSFHRVSCKKTKQNGIPELRNTIETVASELYDALHTEIPKTWDDIRQEIRVLNDKKKYIEYEKFLDIYKHHTDTQGEGNSPQNTPNENGQATIDSSKNILQFLHDTGVVFYQDNLFKNRIILDQQWVIEAIYTLLDRDRGIYTTLKQAKGEFMLKNLEKHWASYKPEDQELFISFMESCEMIFVDREDLSKADNHIYIMPQLLNPQKNKLITKLCKHWKNQKQGKAIYYVYEYQHLPRLVIWRFIIKLGNFVDTVEARWMNGIYLDIELEKVEVLAEAYPSERKIQITLSGEQSSIRKILKMIKTEFEEIHQNDWKVKEMISIDGENFIYWETLEQHYEKNDFIQSISSKNGNKEWLDYKQFHIFKDTSSGSITFEDYLKQQESNIDRAQVMKFLKSAFNYEELKLFCLKYFESVYDNLGYTPTLNTISEQLIMYCKQHSRYFQLLPNLKEERATLFNQYIENEGEHWYLRKQTTR